MTAVRVNTTVAAITTVTVITMNTNNNGSILPHDHYDKMLLIVPCY